MAQVEDRFSDAFPFLLGVLMKNLPTHSREMLQDLKEVTNLNRPSKGFISYNLYLKFITVS